MRQRRKHVYQDKSSTFGRSVRERNMNECCWRKYLRSDRWIAHTHPEADGILEAIDLVNGVGSTPRLAVPHIAHSCRANNSHILHIGWPYRT